MVKDELEKTRLKVSALQKVAELYPDAVSGFGQIVSGSLMARDADSVVSTEDNGWAAFFLSREVDGLSVRTPKVHCVSVLDWLRVHNPTALEEAILGVKR